MFKKVECKSKKGYELRKKYRNTVIEEVKINKDIEMNKYDIENGFLYDRNTRYLASLGNVIALTTWYRFEDGQLCPIIITDILFDELSETAQRFTILHEMGHHINGDLDDIDKESERIFEEEIKADEHALTELTIEEVISSLKELNKIIELLYPYGITQEDLLGETNMRIKHFEKML